MTKSKEVEQNKNIWTTNNQVVYNLFPPHFTPEMDTNLQGLETWGTINTKKDGLGLITLICNVTHRRDDTAQAMANTVRADKDLMICHKKEHISLT